MLAPVWIKTTVGLYRLYQDLALSEDERPPDFWKDDAYKDSRPYLAYCDARMLDDDRDWLMSEDGYGAAIEALFGALVR